MKKLLSALMALMLVVSMCAMNVFAADEVVYVDGANGKDVADGATGAKDKPFNNLVDALAALENGGKVVIIGDVDPLAKLNIYKWAKDDDGNSYMTDELYTDRVDLIAKGDVVITSEGGGIIFSNSESMNYNNIGNITYSKCVISMNGGGRVMFSAFNGQCVVLADNEITGSAGNYVYCNGVFEWYHPYGFAHIFANYVSGSGVATPSDTVVVLGGDTVQATLWNSSGDCTTNLGLFLQDNAVLSTFHADGQTSLLDANVWLFISGNASVSAVNVDGHANAGKAEKAYQSGGTTFTGFKPTSEYPVGINEVNESAALFNKVFKEYKVTADVNSLCTASNIDESAKMFAIVDGAAVEMGYTDTLSDGVFFSTIEGATNYVFADAVKAEEPKDETAAPTGDNMAVFAILGAVALAGAFTFKKVR
ncbi:MAG: hypothetical protein E7665_00630 [Ruminococcaceae bacterium]|nr:hypothetical protein [Oscillospiraceae bacterium]